MVLDWLDEMEPNIYWPIFIVPEFLDSGHFRGRRYAIIDNMSILTKIKVQKPIKAILDWNTLIRRLWSSWVVTVFRICPVWSQLAPSCQRREKTNEIATHFLFFFTSKLYFTNLIKNIDVNQIYSRCDAMSR